MISQIFRCKSCCMSLLEGPLLDNSLIFQNLIFGKAKSKIRAKAHTHHGLTQELVINGGLMEMQRDNDAATYISRKTTILFTNNIGMEDT